MEKKVHFCSKCRIAAEKMGWSTNTISKLEKGDRRIDILEFAELIKIYKKPVNYFFKEPIK